MATKKETTPEVDYLKAYNAKFEGAAKAEPISNVDMKKIDLSRLDELAAAIGAQFPNLISPDSQGTGEVFALVTKPADPKGNVCVWQSGKCRLVGSLRALEFDFYAR